MTPFQKAVSPKRNLTPFVHAISLIGGNKVCRVSVCVSWPVTYAPTGNIRSPQAQGIGPERRLAVEAVVSLRPQRCRVRHQIERNIRPSPERRFADVSVGADLNLTRQQPVANKQLKSALELPDTSVIVRAEESC